MNRQPRTFGRATHSFPDPLMNPLMRGFTIRRHGY
jgi:hypothetical protein